MADDIKVSDYIRYKLYQIFEPHRHGFTCLDEREIRGFLANKHYDPKLIDQTMRVIRTWTSSLEDKFTYKDKEDGKIKTKSFVLKGKEGQLFIGLHTIFQHCVQRFFDDGKN